MKKLRGTVIITIVIGILLFILYSLEFDVKPNSSCLSKALSTYRGEIKVDVEVIDTVYIDNYLYVLFKSIHNKYESGYGVFQKGINSKYRFVRASYQSPRKLYNLYDNDVSIVYGIRLGTIATSYSIEYLDGTERKTFKDTIYDEGFINVYKGKIDMQHIQILDKDDRDITDVIINANTRIKDSSSDTIVAESFMIYVYCLFVLCIGLFLIVSLNLSK